MNHYNFATVVSVRIAVGLFLIGLLVLSYQVLHIFFVPIAWAAILSYVSWPLYLRLRQALGSYSRLAPLLMTLLLGCAFALPLLWIIAMLREELPTAYVSLIEALGEGGENLAPHLQRIP